MNDFVVKVLPLAGLSTLMLLLSYAFSLQESSGSVPVILLFAGLFFTLMVAFFTAIDLERTE